MKKHTRGGWLAAVVLCGLLMLLSACQPVQRLPAAPGVSATTTTQNNSALTDHPDATTQARLRLAYSVFRGPNVDLFVNGAVAVNGGQAQVNIPSDYVNGYLYLAPGTYQVAVTPTGEGIDQALGGALEAPLVAGHRYTLAMMGQFEDHSVKPLLIDETAVEMKIGAQPTDAVRITVNNLAGAAGLDAEWNGKLMSKNIPYGGFDAEIYAVENARIKITVSDDPAGILLNDLADWNEPGATFLYGFTGKYASPGAGWETFNAPLTSELNIIDFLQGFSGKQLAMHGALTSFDTFLAAIKTAGLTEELAHGGPHLVLAPTDAAFAALPKAKREALLADPKALGDLVRNYIVAGYVPRGSLAETPGGPLDRTFTNLLGEQMKIGNGFNEFTVNGRNVGDFGSYFFADGSQVHPISTVLLTD